MEKITVTAQVMRTINTIMSSVAVFLLIAMYNRFEKKLDTVDELKVGQAHIMGRLDVSSKQYDLQQMIFDNQLKQANHLLDEVADCDNRLYYLELMNNVKTKNKRNDNKE